jgi:SprT-like family
MTNAPTHQTYSGLQAAYDHFNRRLFGGKLPGCLITMQRQRGYYGFFAGDRFASQANERETIDEIALNPVHLTRPPDEVLSTLVHEMVHLFQHHFGNPSRNGYHNREWADAMEARGLIPSETGKPGGKQTGQRMSHYIQKGGRFEIACFQFLKSKPAVFYYDRAGDDDARAKKRASKTKFTCPNPKCKQNAWAKPDANLLCGNCRKEMEPEEPAGDD